MTSPFSASRQDLPARDYVSPNLPFVMPDAAFPFMIVGSTSQNSWPYLRRDIPHNWYIDKRAPGIGFLSRDEASILYNIARIFSGQRALEIGCWLGWTACHMALGGVMLDTIDPLLVREDFRDSIAQSLHAAGVLDRVNLIAGSSPKSVVTLAEREKRKWPLIFIDGNHEEPGPIEDAIVCELLTTPDAMVVFHDLTSPAVARGLEHFRTWGWKTLIYNTMQILGVAYRGNITPVEHIPDPTVTWVVPEHLRQHPVSGPARS